MPLHPIATAALLGVVTVALAAPAAAAGGDVLPRPASVEWGEGALPVTETFSADTSQCRDDRVAAAAARLPGRLLRWTGMRVLPGGSRPALLVRCGAAPARVQRPIEDESYALVVTAGGAEISAATPYGALHGIETLLQLVTPVESGFAVPAVRIVDRPRFPWRGLHVDASRHFMPVEAMRRTLDGMAVVKMNVLHWHLTDDQGFRVESRRYPRLHRMGSDGEFYTQAQLREVVAYARARGIRVVPEFDMPGHTTSWLVGHPELASAPGPYVIERRWGIFDPTIDPTRDEVYRFLARFLGEMTEIFPDECLHIGGDEVNGVQWNGSATIAAFKQKHGLADNDELQTHFNRRLLPILSRHGKSMVGWDEILQPDLPADAIVQSWRGAEGLAAAVRAGHRSILSSGYYLDHLKPAAFHYAVDPLGVTGGELSPAESARVLGGEGCMWNEYCSSEMLDGRIWPRAAAIAERLWSPAAVADVDDLYRRLDLTSARLEHEGLHHRSGPAAMLRRLAGGRDDDGLIALADALEPLGIGGRAPARDYTSLTPLNRLVDSLPVESGAARRFSAAVAAFLADPGRAAGRAEVARRLTIWARLDGELRPPFATAPALTEIEPIADDLAVAARAAARAVAAGGAATPTDDERAALDRLLGNRAEVRVAVAPALASLLGGGQS